MSESYENARKMARAMLGSGDVEQVQEALRPKPEGIPKLATSRSNEHA